MMLGTYSARGRRRIYNACVFCKIQASVGSTPTFATHAASHVYLLFNRIQAHISDLADAARRVRAMYRHAYGTPTISGDSVFGGRFYFCPDTQVYPQTTDLVAAEHSFTNPIWLPLNKLNRSDFCVCTCTPQRNTGEQTRIAFKVAFKAGRS